MKMAESWICVLKIKTSPLGSFRVANPIDKRGTKVGENTNLSWKSMAVGFILFTVSAHICFLGYTQPLSCFLEIGFLIFKQPLELST